MAKRPAKSLEDLDQYIHDDNLMRDPEARARRSQQVFAALGLVMLVLGLGTIIFGIVEVRKFTNNGNWPTVTGTITRASVQTINRRRAPDYYCVFATYNYQVGSRTYSHGWSTQDCNSSRAEIERIAPSYLGGTAPIWYDPTNPDRSLNQPVGMEWMIIIWGAGALVILFAGTLLMLAMQKPEVKRRFKRPAKPL
jgi:hypothetical protein